MPEDLPIRLWSGKERSKHGADDKTIGQSPVRKKPGNAGAYGGICSAGPAGYCERTGFLTIFLIVISFYFGTQSEKIQSGLDSENDKH